MLDLAAGTALGPYVIDEVAGRGGAGVVYKATHSASGETVAIKAARDSHDENTANRLRREAGLLETIEHPGVVGFQELLEVDGQPFLVIDWVQGKPLAHHLATAGPMPVGRALQLLTPLAETLDHLHGQGTVHRDLSPANLMLHQDRLTLIDLGVGRGAQTTTVTMDGTTVGTPRYMAPEVIRGEDVDGRADQYSVATMLHELVSGQPPLPGTDDIATALHHQLNTQPIPLTEVDPYVPPAVEAAVLRGLSKDPADRHGSVAQLISSAAAGGSGTGVSAHGGTPRWLLPVALLALGVFVGVVIAVLVSGGDDGGQNAPWTAGTARSSACNLLAQPDFDTGGLPVDYFAIPEGTEEIQTVGGLENSASLQIGRADQFGQYAELVPVTAGLQYVFGGFFSRTDDVFEASIGISWLDISASTEVGETIEADLRPTQGGFHVVGAQAPPGAAFALPFTFKDSSPGLVAADELIFGPASACENLTSLTGDAG